MDTIRTVYIDSQHSTERNGSYVYDLQGGIAVPEGARVFVDNVSFTNTFSEEMTTDNTDKKTKTNRMRRRSAATTMMRTGCMC